METKTLELFADVVRRGGFAAAARAHDLDPSSVSRAVAQLEQELGVRLLQRTTRRLSLTEAGALYLARVAPALEEIDRAREEALTAGGAPSGVLRLTASVAFGLARITPLLREFRAAFPELRLELVLSDANLDLIEERIDLAIRLAPEIRGDLVAAKLMPTRYRVVASPDYLALAPALTAPADLAAHSCVLFALPGYRERWLFRDHAGGVLEAPVTGDMVLSNALAIRDAARAGLGPALLGDWLLAEDLAEGRLVDVFPDHEAAATSFDTAAWLVYPSRAFLPAKTRAAIDFLRARLTRRP